MKKFLKSPIFKDAVLVSKVFVLVAIPTSLLLLHVSNQYRITEVGYEIADVTGEYRQLLEENKKLTVEARVQGRSERVAEVGRRQFGLEETRPEQVITVELESPGKIEEHAALDTTGTTGGQAAIQ